MEGLNLEEYGFEVYYETGVEQATWVYPKDAKNYDWHYMIVTPYDTHRSLKLNKQPIYKIYKINKGGNTKIKYESIYTGLIPSSEFAHILFINLRMHSLPHVRREDSIKDILNKK